jgi:alcohol dehydrogenase (cytochrome c)
MTTTTAARPRWTATLSLMRLAASLLVLGGARVLLVNAQGLQSATYTAAQAAGGKDLYARHCATCHGAHLDDGPFAPPLSGVQFQASWGGQTVDLLLQKLTTMPPGTPGTLAEDTYVQLLAFLLQANKVTAGVRPLPADPALLSSMIFAGASGSGEGVAPGLALSPPPPRRNPLDRITPVTDAMLANPPDGDWLTWRRSIDAQGFSPLQQITKRNVRDLRVAWSWSLPPGPNEVTPLEHDGVLFVAGYGDKVQALDAATGDLLWQYSRWLPKGVSPALKRAIALGGDRLFLPTSDAHIVALDVRTGRVVWETAVGDAPEFGMTGGPLVAKGKVIVGTTGRAAGGNLIVALDAATGRIAWRFHTIPRPGEPGGQSWNGLPVEKRTGGSVWTAGSYDPTLNLVFFGPSPTYDTATLRNRVSGANNDALYTNATVALNPDTGKLAWYYSHLPNDQWDLDWAFERHLVRLSLNGSPKTYVVTGGKPAIFDALEADSGKYVYSMDLGLQNFVLSIDPTTGAKKIDETKVPGDGTTKFVCPDTIGGKNWLPSSYNPTTKLLFVPLFEACVDYVPVAPGERGLLSTGVRLSLRPRPGSDGKYGRLEAINLETRKVAWVTRQYAPRTSGVLATAGGVVFAGSLDRVFAAYDDADGRELWHVRLNDIPGTAPITYSANGKQYVAVVVGGGGHHNANVAPITPDIRNPPDRGAAVWVFELAED